MISPAWVGGSEGESTGGEVGGERGEEGEERGRVGRGGGTGYSSRRSTVKEVSAPTVAKMCDQPKAAVHFTSGYRYRLDLFIR